MTAPKTKKTAPKKPSERFQPLSSLLAMLEEEESSESDVDPTHTPADEDNNSEEDNEGATEKGGETDKDEEEEEPDGVEFVEVPQKRKGQTKGNKKSFSFNPI